MPSRIWHRRQTALSAPYRPRTHGWRRALPWESPRQLAETQLAARAASSVMQQPARCGRSLLLPWVCRLAGHRLRGQATSPRSGSTFNKPLSGNDCPRPGGIATFMRLPYAATPHGIEFKMQLIKRAPNKKHYIPRTFSLSGGNPLLPYGAAPYDSLQVGDVGDVPVTMYDIRQAVADIENFVKGVLGHGCIPVGIGGDHTTTYPVLRAIKEKHGPVGLLHLDAHADVNPTMMHCELAHGTPFYRAVQEGLLDTRRVVQIGLRGSVYGPNEELWSLQHGFHIIQAQECWFKSMVPIMETKVLPVLGAGPVYISFDIDCLDPAFAPGTGELAPGIKRTIPRREPPFIAFSTFEWLARF
ncbi:hypothetical protein HPB48_020162 [Haemaphysalis longicornis]|uniref:Agmatinase n=1 Tax=Haemaphysalis longicornis TaxID=44386 RepID=A0A9J6FKB5_HAELO|nr:hypothetical protein HPB48_020162 [Haemaphysalis longicornis]